MSEHVPEPWAWGEDCETKAICIYEATGQNRGNPIVYDGECLSDEEAARIVACVNACKGLNPETVPKLLEALEWIETYIANQPLDSLAQFLITKKIREAKGEA